MARWRTAERPDVSLLNCQQVSIGVKAFLGSGTREGATGCFDVSFHLQPIPSPSASDSLRQRPLSWPVLSFPCVGAAQQADYSSPLKGTPGYPLPPFLQHRHLRPGQPTYMCRMSGVSPSPHSSSGSHQYILLKLPHSPFGLQAPKCKSQVKTDQLLEAWEKRIFPLLGFP